MSPSPASPTDVDDLGDLGDLGDVGDIAQVDVTIPEAIPAAPADAHTPAYRTADLTTCDSEPIHIPGAIQPHGVLLSVDPGDLGDPAVRAEQDAPLTVVMASVNTEEMLGLAVTDVVGRPLADVLGEEAAALVRRRIAEDFPADPLVTVLRGADAPLAGRLLGAEVDLHVHRSGGRVVVEAEPVAGAEGAQAGYRLARSAMGRLARTLTLPELTHLLATEIRDLTGFDRVMVYRFDERWNGEVVAEVCRPDLNPFLGLHYPASDIPAQARRLYTINPIRLIVDIGYQPVPLHPILDDVTRAPLDLSFSSLRSVSPIHVEYLANMGVSASMSVSIVIDDELWGLIACHHYSGPHRPSHEARAASEFVTQVAAGQIAYRVRADARDAALDTQAELSGLTTRLSAADVEPLAALAEDPSFLSVLGAHGAAIYANGQLRTRGEVPPLAVLPAIADALFNPDSYISTTDHLAALDPDGAHGTAFADVAAIASGVLRAGTLADQWCLWFRPEQREVVDWGGDPRNKLLYEAEAPTVRLSPRKSFDKWREETHGHSQPWEPWRVEAADELGRHLNSLLLLRSREQIAMAESMQRNVVLDRAPGFDGVELVARYRPASTYQLGGDWWDAFELTDGRLAFVVGDVAGHGVAAASAMTQVRTALRAYLYEGHSPAVALDRLDQLMDGLLDFGVATAVVLVLDPATGGVELANAGHPTPMIARAGGGADVLEMPVRPLLGIGIDEAPTFHLDLPDGDLIVLFTDGLIERRGVDLAETTEQLRRLAGSRGPDEDVEAWSDRMLTALDTTDDDTTLLVVGRKPPV